MEQADIHWFHDTVSALVYSLLLDHSNESPEQLPVFNDVTQFVLQQHANLPDYLRGPMLAATFAFDFSACFRAGALFHSRPHTVRRRQIAQWKKSKLSARRDLIRYFQSLGTWGLHSRQSPEAQGAIGLASPETNPSLGVISQPPAELKCEIGVIGSGPGGAITACLLAEAGRNVLLIEEGNFYQLESCVPFSRTEMLQKYRNGGQTLAMGKNKIAYVEGRCVGGGSEINSGLYHRTPLPILERWRTEYQVEALTERDLLPHFEACERELSVSPQPGEPIGAARKLAEGASRLGWKSLQAPRWVRYDGGDNRGTRQSMTRTYLPRFLKAGGKLLPGTRVCRISGGAPWMLDGLHGKAGVRIAAEKLFVCGGAVQTAALLRRSGIRQNIGDSLQMHPTVKIVAKFPEPVNSEAMGVPTQQVNEFSPRLGFGCSVSTRPYLALSLLDQLHRKEIEHDWTRMAVFYAMITSEGRGTVRTFGSFRDPLVRYQLTLQDRRNLAEGLRKLAGLLFEAGAERAFPGISETGPVCSQDEVSKLPEILPEGLANLMTIHLFSSCPMGEDKRKCATDSFGRVHGFKNLYLADASLLCTAPGVNPQGSIMALARRNVLQFLAR